MLGSGIDFLHGPVTHRPPVILALHGDTLATTVHDNVDALIPCSPNDVMRTPDEVTAR